MEKVLLSEQYDAGQHYFRVEAECGLPATTCASWDEVLAFLADISMEYELVAVR